MDNSENQQHVDDLAGDVYLAYVGYLKRYGKHKITPFNFTEFKVILKSFYDFTLNAYIHGDLEKPDGSYWESSSEAMQAWEQHHGLNDLTSNAVFRANDDVAGYS